MSDISAPAATVSATAGGARLDRVLRWTFFLTIVAAVAVLVYGTIAVYQGAPPIPDKVVGADGATPFTGDDVIAGKAIFQRTDLMDFGSLYGNGAYFGPDWNTDYLHRETSIVQDIEARTRFSGAYEALTTNQQSTVDALVRSELRTNTYRDGVLTLTPAEETAHRQIAADYRRLFQQGDRALGLPADVVRSPSEADQLTAFVGWTAWTTVASRPGETASYTNNWPYDPAVGNQPTDAMWTWTWLSLVGFAVIMALVWIIYRRVIASPLHSGATPPDPDVAPLSASQLATWKWFLIVPALLVLQGLVGALIQHDYADRGGFFGVDLSGILPFNIVKGWHLQIAIAWIAAAWMGAGLFLVPIIGRREPRHQRSLVNLLWVAVVLVVVGSVIGLWVGVKVDLGAAWFWIGNQGLEYIQIGRAFQIALFAGLMAWAAILARGFWPGLRQLRGWTSIEHLLLYSAAAIGLVYAFGMLPISTIMASPTLTDFWRWWVVHMWVENTFEFFTVAAIGYALMTIGLLSRQLVERAVYFELILVFGSGIIGMGHHFYWAGEPAIWLTLGAMFGILEVIPLLILVVRAWQEYRAIRATGSAFPQRTAFYFFTAASVWNFVGAGVMGGLINPPIVSYYQHGEFLTSAHAHASMFGAFGLLAVGLVYLSVRGMVPAVHWSDRLGLAALGAFNAAIVLWLALNLVPIGIGQLVATIEHGYWYARSLAFYDQWTLFQWLRMPGDIAFLVGGLLVFVDLAGKLRHRRAATVDEERAPRPTLRRLADQRP